jgi:hypothetical protein
LAPYPVPFELSASRPLLTSVSDFAEKHNGVCFGTKDKTKDIFLKRVACTSANQYPFAFYAEVVGDAIFPHPRLPIGRGEVLQESYAVSC